MSTVPRRRPDSRAYKMYSDEILQEALHAVKNEQMSLRQASEHYKIPLGTLSNKFKEKHTEKPGRPTAFSVTEELITYSVLQIGEHNYLSQLWVFAGKNVRWKIYFHSHKHQWL